ncbi:MAG: MFS transporter [Acidobacteriaceae bacterium]
MTTNSGPPSEASAGTSSTVCASGAAVYELRRRWWYLLPAVFIAYSLAYVDRVNYGLGAAAGLASTLHITGQQNALLSALFFLGYFFFQVPGIILVGKRSPVRLIFVALGVWGVLAALTGVIRVFWILALDRFLLGVAESCIIPAMLLLLTRWFTKAERSRANTLLIAANPVTVLWMSVITGYLMEAVGWQRAFIYEGIPAVLWAVVWILVARDSPAEAKWMSPEATTWLQNHLDAEQLAFTPEGAIKAVLMRGDVLLLSAVYFCWSLGIYGFILWLPTIVRRGAALSMGATGLFSAIPYVAAVLLMLVAAHRSDKSMKRKSMVWPFLLIAGIALWCSFLFAPSSFPLAFVGLIVAGACMYAPYGPFFAIVPERVSRSSTAEVLAFINSAGALGAFIGSYLVGWLQTVTGNARAGYLLMAGALVCSAALMLLLNEQGLSEKRCGTRE